VLVSHVESLNRSRLRELSDDRSLSWWRCGEFRVLDSKKHIEQNQSDRQSGRGVDWAETIKEKAEMIKCFVSC
jgi:hypothetical protein